MKIKFATIDILDTEQHQRELNAFLASHSILAVGKEFVQLGERAYWAFCIEYGEPGSAASTEGSARKPKVDYREILTPEEFEVYARLREIRKQLAEREDIPVYAVLTNAQLAEIVQKRVTTRDGLSGIKGIGEAKVAKFGDELLACLRDTTEGGQP